MGAAKPEHVPSEWTPNTAKIIDKMFEDVYRKLRVMGSGGGGDTTGDLANGLDTLVPAVGDLIACITAAGLFELLPIVATAQRVLTNNGGVPTWAAVNLATGVTGTLPIGNGGTGLTGVVQGDVLYGSATDVLSKLAKNTTATRYLSNTGTSNNPAWAQVALNNGVTGQLPFANIADVSATARILARKSAGPGVIEEATLSEILDFIGSAAQGDVLYRGAASWARLAAGTNGHFLQTQGAAANPQWASVTGSAGLPIFTGTGNPQGQTGVVACEQAPGSIYVDTNNGYVYRKLGGGTTAYGWYLDMGFPNIVWSTVRPYIFLPPHSSTSQNPSSGVASQFLSADGFNGTSLNNTAREYAAGQAWMYHDTGITINTSSYWNTTASQFRWWEYDFDFSLRFRTPGTITSLRLWFGLSTAVITNNDAIAAGAKSAAMFRYSTGASDPGWVGFAANAAAAGAESVTGNVANIAADTVYNLRIRLKRSGTPTLYFSVNDGTEVTLTTNIPPTGVNSFIMGGVTNLTGAVRGFRWGGVTGWYGTPA